MYVVVELTWTYFQEVMRMGFTSFLSFKIDLDMISRDLIPVYLKKRNMINFLLIFRKRSPGEYFNCIKIMLMPYFFMILIIVRGQSCGHARVGNSTRI